MIHLMLNDLRRPAGEVLCSRLHFQGLILHLDSFIALTLTGVAEKRQTAFLGVVRAILLDDLGIEHHRVCRSSSALVEKGNDALATPIIFAAMPTQLSLCAISVSSKSCATCKSSFVASSDFPARKMGSCISSLTILHLQIGICLIVKSI